MQPLQPLPAPIVQGGRVRMSRLSEAVAASKIAPGIAVGGNDASANRASPKPGVKATANSDEAEAPGEVAAGDVDDHVAKAKAGDQDSIDWLKTAGLLGLIGGGVAGTGLLLSRANKNAKRLQLQHFGADNVAADAKTANNASAVAKPVKKPVLQLQYQPAIQDGVVTPEAPPVVKQLTGPKGGMNFKHPGAKAMDDAIRSKEAIKRAIRGVKSL
jgi:hypothetical protein